MCISGTTNRKQGLQKPLSETNLPKSPKCLYNAEITLRKLQDSKQASSVQAWSRIGIQLRVHFIARGDEESVQVTCVIKAAQIATPCFNNTFTWITSFYRGRDKVNNFEIGRAFFRQ